MYTSKFYTLLATLQEEEVAAFHKYLRLVHAKKDTALRLFEYFRKVYAKPKAGEKLELDYVYRKIYDTDIGNNRKAMLNTLSDLYLWLKEFLLCEKAKSRAFESRILWLSVLQERSLDTEFSKHADLLRNEMEALPKRETMDYLKSLVVHHFAYFNNAHDKSLQDDQRLQSYLNELDLYRSASQLKAACEKVNLKNIRPADFIPASWLEQMQPSTLFPKAHPLLLLYQQVYQLMDTQQEEIFARIEVTLDEHAGSIEPGELNTILLYLYNYASSQIRKGKETVWEKIHYLNRLSVERNVFIKNGEMTIAQFQNIVNTACKVKDFNWVKSFIATQSNYLKPDIRIEAVQLANTMVIFEKRDYKSVVKALEKKPPKDIHIQIRTKAILLISYHELESPDIDILNFCTNFELFLKRNRKSLMGAVLGTLNFIRFVKMLICKKIKQSQIIEQIEKTESLYFRPWLLEKANTYKAIIAAHKQNK